MKRLQFLFALLALTVAIGVWCWHSTAAAPTDAVIPQREQRSLVAALGWVDIEGGTRHLSAKAEGIVSEVAEVGDQLVAAGTVLMRLDEQTLRLDEQANALERTRHQQSLQAMGEQLRLAEQQVARLQGLVAIQAEAGEVLRQAEADVQSLKASLQAARLAEEGSRLQQQRLALQRKQQVIVAPRRGRILRTEVHMGETVTVGRPVIWFAPDAPLIVRAEVDERLISQLKTGMNATVEAEAGDGRIYPAKLLRIARAIGPVRALPEIRAAAKDDRVVECILTLGEAPLLIGQRVVVRIGSSP